MLQVNPVTWMRVQACVANTAASGLCWGCLSVCLSVSRVTCLPVTCVTQLYLFFCCGLPARAGRTANTAHRCTLPYLRSVAFWNRRRPRLYWRQSSRSGGFGRSSFVRKGLSCTFFISGVGNLAVGWKRGGKVAALVSAGARFAALSCATNTWTFFSHAFILWLSTSFLGCS